MRALRRRDAAHGPQLVDRGLQRLAVDVLHRVVVDAVLLADGEDRHDVRMVQLGGRLGFVAEAGDLPLVEHRGERQDLERHAAVERNLLGLVDDAHAAAADLADDLVVADLLGGGLARPLPLERSHRPQVVRGDVQLVEAVEIGLQFVGQIGMRGEERGAIRRGARAPGRRDTAPASPPTRAAARPSA